MTDAMPGCSPITSTLDFVEGSFEQCLEGYLGTRRRILDNIARAGGGRSSPPDVRRLGSLTLSEKIALLKPVVHPGFTKVLLTETASGWCCAMANGMHGIGSADHVAMTAEAMRKPFLRVVLNATKGAESFQFCHTDFAGTTKAERVVYVHNEGGWRFFEHGTPLAFEKPEASRAKRKRDRLTVDMIGDYCLALGIDLRAEGFFDGACAIVDHPPMPQTRPVRA